MSKPTRLLATALCLFALAPRAAAWQQPSAQTKKTAPKKAAAEADPMAEVRRMAAISLINTLAIARSVLEKK